MTTTSDVLIDQANITKLERAERQAVSLTDGQCRLRIQSFALTANNVTYAATGFQIGYWKFFPTEAEGKGIVPVWGHAIVTESSSPHLEIGQRLYGFYPLAEELVITPHKARGKVVVDVSEHRKDLPAIYNIYTATDRAPSDADHYKAILQPLIATSYLLWDWLMDNERFGADQIIVGSASSKTGLGLCKFLSETENRSFKVIGLTSESNTDFVTGLGFCDEVRTYDEIEDISRSKSVYVDMAGNGAVKVRLHTHLADMLMYSCAVGLSHWDKFEKLPEMPGPKPQFFFAPAQIAKRKEEWGPGVIERKIGEAGTAVAAGAADWMDLKVHSGLDEAMAVFGNIASGQSKPSEGHVVVLGEI